MREIAYVLSGTSPSGHDGMTIPIDCDSASVRTLPNGDIIVPNSCLIVAGHKVLTLDAGIVDPTAETLSGEATVTEIDSAIWSLHMELWTASTALNIDAAITNGYGAIWACHMKLWTASATLNVESSVSNVNSATGTLYVKLRTATGALWDSHTLSSIGT